MGSQLVEKTTNNTRQKRHANDAVCPEPKHLTVLSQLTDQTLWQLLKALNDSLLVLDLALLHPRCHVAEKLLCNKNGAGA